MKCKRCKCKVMTNVTRQVGKDGLERWVCPKCQNVQTAPAMVKVKPVEPTVEEPAVAEPVEADVPVVDPETPAEHKPKRGRGRKSPMGSDMSGLTGGD